MKLRMRQIEALTAAKDRYDAGVRRMVIQHPTGTGKTPIFAALRQFFGFKGKVMVLIHKEELAKQAADKLHKWNPDEKIGIEKALQTADDDCTFVVASVPTIGAEGSTRIFKFNPDEFDAVICDEAHHAVADSWQRVLRYFGFMEDELPKTRLLLGVTATPNRGDGKALGIVFDELVYQYPILDAVREGWLAVPFAYQVHTTTSLDDVHTIRGDFAKDELAHAVDNPVRNALVVKAYREHAYGMKAVVFTVNILHAKHLAEEFNRHGIRGVAVWGTDKDREKKLEAYASGDIDVLMNCDLLTEGVDIWQICCVIMAAPTKSQLKFVQRVGRGLRIEEALAGIGLVEARKQGLLITKETCLVLDIADTTKQHTLASVPSIFGLPPKLNLNGKSVVEAAEIIEAEVQDNPDLDFSGLTNLEDIASYIEDVDLFALKLPDSMDKVSAFGWYKTPAGTYMLRLLDGHEYIEVFRDVTQHWTAKGTVRSHHFMHGGFKQPEDGIKFGDMMLNMLGQGLLTELKRRAKQGSRLATYAQWVLIRELATVAQVNNIPDKLTKAEAERMIHHLMQANVDRARRDAKKTK